MKKTYIKRYHSKFKIRYLLKLADALRKYREQIIYQGISTNSNTTQYINLNQEIYCGLNYDWNFDLPNIKKDLDQMVLWMGK